MSSALKSISLLGLGFLLSLNSISCKQKSKKSASANPSPSPVSSYDPSTDGSGAQTASITVRGRTGTSFTFAVNETIQLDFEVSSGTGTNYQFALTETPNSAAQITTVGSVGTLRWGPAPAGTYYATVLARDMDLCQQTNISQTANCQIPVGVATTPDSRYDMTQRYTLVVGNASTTNNVANAANTNTSGQLISVLAKVGTTIITFIKNAVSG